MTKKEKKGFWAEFKEFISRGSVMDLAVGVIIGGAFTAIVNSFIADIISPVLGLILGGLDLSQYSIAIGKSGAVIAYGSFIQNIISFLITALVIFIMVKGVNKFHRKKEAEPVASAPDPQVVLLTEIRDMMKEK